MTLAENNFYFQLVFANGKSGYVLANQQLSGDGFRTGHEETFSISTNRDYGELQSVRIIPDDNSKDSSIFDKLNIDKITVSRGSNTAVSRTWVIENVGWIEIDYGWTENDGGTVTVKIGGRWDKKCAWKAEYDEEILTCTPDKKGKAFTIGSLDARTGEVDLRLYREGEELWEYGICIRTQGNGSGGVVVLATTHEKPAFEGSYTVWQMEDNSVLIRIHTEHSWKSRLVSRELSAELAEVDTESCSLLFGSSSAAFPSWRARRTARAPSPQLWR